MDSQDVSPPPKSVASQTRSVMRDYRFRWTDRLHEKQDFSTVFRDGRRIQLSGLTLWVFRHPEVTTPPRIGFAISRHYGNAVARNRIKRLLRESFRLNRHRLPKGVDLVFSARPMGRKLQYVAIEALVLKLWTKAAILSPSNSAAL